jgi:hypothetical protein
MAGPSAGWQPVASTSRVMKIRFAAGSIAPSRKAWRACASRKAVGANLFFPPVHLSIETAAPDLPGRLYRSPRLYGLEQSRWTLQALQKQVAWLQHTRSGNPMS